MNNVDLLNPLVNKVSLLIGSALGYVARAVNKGMVLLYWNIGKTIQEEIIKSERAEYGKRIVQTLSAQLIAEFGKGYNPLSISPKGERLRQLIIKIIWAILLLRQNILLKQ